MRLKAWRAVSPTFHQDQDLGSRGCRRRSGVSGHPDGRGTPEVDSTYVATSPASGPGRTGFRLATVIDLRRLVGWAMAEQCGPGWFTTALRMAIGCVPAGEGSELPLRPGAPSKGQGIHLSPANAGMTQWRRASSPRSSLSWSTAARGHASPDAHIEIVSYIESVPATIGHAPHSTISRRSSTRSSSAPPDRTRHSQAARKPGQPHMRTGRRQPPARDQAHRGRCPHGCGEFRSNTSSRGCAPRLSPDLLPARLD